MYVFLVEDHPVLRDVLEEYIRDMPDVGRCATAATAEDALARMTDDIPDCMLIDLLLPGMNGIELVRELRRTHRQLPLAILSGHESLTYARDALEAGANAYLVKGDLEEISRGMAAILAGNRYVSDGLGADP